MKERFWILAVCLIVILACGAPTSDSQPTGAPTVKQKINCPHLLYIEGRYYNPNAISYIDEGWYGTLDSYSRGFDVPSDEPVKKWCAALKAQAELGQSSPSSSRE